MIQLLTKKELPIEYEKYAWIYDDFKYSFYKITNWLTDDYFKTAYGSFLWDDSKSKVMEKIVTKDKIIIKLLCIYDLGDKFTERSRSD